MEAIKSQKELFNKIKPALDIKFREFKGRIKEEDLWGFLIKTKWQEAKGLDLAEMVDDILKLKEEDYYQYVETKEKEVI